MDLLGRIGGRKVDILALITWTACSGICFTFVEDTQILEQLAGSIYAAIALVGRDCCQAIESICSCFIVVFMSMKNSIISPTQGIKYAAVTSCR